jgi:hypothetical protein
MGGDVYLAGLSDVLAGFGDGHGFLAEAYGEFTGDAGVELAHGQDLLGFSRNINTLTATVSIARG